MGMQLDEHGSWLIEVRSSHGEFYLMYGEVDMIAADLDQLENLSQAVGEALDYVRRKEASD